MKYCEHIAHTISFNEKDILPCCTSAGFNPPSYYNSRLESHNIVSSIDIDEKQEDAFDIINSNKIEKWSCKNCMFCKEISEMPKDGNKINSIFLRQWIKDEAEEDTNSLPINYEAYELIKKMYETNKIDADELTVRMQSKNLATITNLDKYLDLFAQYGVKAIHVSTDNIVYNEKLAKLMKEQKASINISLDCGTKEMYQLIKKADNFDSIIENLKKYADYTGDSDIGICIHYVLQKDINDNQKEIDSFIDLMKNIGIKNIGIRINGDTLDAFLSGRDGDVLTYKNLITYFYEEANKYGFELDNDSCIEQNFVLEKKPAKKGFFAKIFG